MTQQPNECMMIKHLQAVSVNKNKTRTLFIYRLYHNKEINAILWQMKYTVITTLQLHFIWIRFRFGGKENSRTINNISSGTIFFSESVDSFRNLIIHTRNSKQYALTWHLANDIVCIKYKDIKFRTKELWNDFCLLKINNFLNSKFYLLEFNNRTLAIETKSQILWLIYILFIREAAERSSLCAQNWNRFDGKMSTEIKIDRYTK